MKRKITLRGAAFEYEYECERPPKPPAPASRFRARCLLAAAGMYCGMTVGVAALCGFPGVLVVAAASVLIAAIANYGS